MTDDHETFPDVRWGRPEGRLAQVGHRLAATRGGSRTIRALVPLDRWLLDHSGGRVTVLGPFGTPLLLLTTTGARTGRPRTTPLVYLRHGPQLLVAASNFGQAAHPAWSANLVAHPEARVTLGRRTVPVRARALEGAERDAAWARFEALSPAYRAYGLRTDRPIRVFALTPFGPAGGG
jgi:deazaflavin-dependent oxidoreductase (nitroreductase family)